MRKILAFLCLCVFVTATLFLPKPSHAQEPFVPKEDSTVGDVMRHFDKEKFDALPEEMKATQSLKELEKENPPFPTINNANTESTVLFTQVFTEQFCPNDTIIYNRYGFPLNPILLGSCLLAPTPVGARALYSTFSPV
jgi:hypothetical protein